jgi:D-psicose/D-tagatose/L-ribulose 3-epimerase
MRIGVIEAVWEGTSYWGQAGFELAKEIGFESIDLARDPLDATPAELAKVADELNAVGLPAVSVVCVALGVADYNPSVQRFHVDRAKRHVELAAEVGAANVLLVIGDYVWRGEVIPRDEQWGMAVRNVRAIAEHAAEHGVEVTLELEPFQYAYVNSVGEMVRFLDDVGVDTLQANADLNHLWPMDIAPEELARWSGRINHGHISDCDQDVYRNLPPGEGSAPLEEYLRALVATGFDGTLSLELEPPPKGRELEEWLRTGYQRTVELLDRVSAPA